MSTDSIYYIILHNRTIDSKIFGYTKVKDSSVMKNRKTDKPWYEKIGIWVGIIAGVCTILTFFYSFNQLLNMNTSIDYDNNEMTTENQSINTIKGNNKNENIQIQDNNSNVKVDNNIITQINNNNETVSNEYITEVFDINSLETASYIKIRVRNKTTGYPAWSTVTSLNVGDEIEFQIEYKNTSEYEQENVLIFDSLPENVKYIEGSLKKHDSNNPNGINMNPDELFTEKGTNIGNFKPGANTYINFTVEVINEDLTNGKKELLNELKCEIGTEKYTISQNYAYSSLGGGWGPERTTYTMAEPAHQAVFNSITDNAAIGDERDFVRIAEKNAGTTYTSELIIRPNKQYSVFIYFHNNASSTFNDKDHNRVGFAANTKVSSFFPSALGAGERQAVFGCISSENTNPKSVWDSAFITAAEDITLHYVPDSAKIYNSHDANKSILPTSLFSNEGTLIGTNKLNGLVPGCDEYAGTIFYTIETIPLENGDE